MKDFPKSIFKIIKKCLYSLFNEFASIKCRKSDKIIPVLLLNTLLFTFGHISLKAEVYDTYAANASHQPFAKGEVEFIPLKVLSPKDPVISLWSSDILDSEPVIIDDEVILPSEKYSELRFEIEYFPRYKDGIVDLVFRSFHSRVDDSDIYFQIQESDEDWFYGLSYKFTDQYAIGDLEVYKGDLNLDDLIDYVIVKYWGGNGIGGGAADVGFLISNKGEYGLEYVFHKTYSYAPGPLDFVILDNKPFFIKCNFHFGDNVDSRHNYWVYNLISLEDAEFVKYKNYAHESFPKIIWYSFKPNNDETTFLDFDQKATLAASSLCEIERVDGCLSFEWRPSVQSIINSFKSKDKEAIMTHMDFPEAIGSRANNTESFIIKNRKEMIEYWDLIFDNDFIESVGNSTFEDWSQVGWRGVMYEDGDIWTAKDGKIILNYVSPKGEDFVRRIDKKFRDFIHPKVSNFKRNKVHFQTDEYHCRIDELNDGNVRLAIWESQDSLDDMPKKVIFNGDEHPMGTGGWYGASFNDGAIKYVYSEGGKYDAVFSIYKDEKKVYFSETESVAKTISSWD